MADRIAPNQRDHPSKYTADQLRVTLVQDAVLNHATDLQWMTLALQRIATTTRGNSSQALEATFNDLLDEVETLTGRRELPLHSGPIR